MDELVLSSPAFEAAVSSLTQAKSELGLPSITFNANLGSPGVFGALETVMNWMREGYGNCQQAANELAASIQQIETQFSGVDTDLSLRPG